MPKVDFREEIANVALAELLEQRGLSEGRYGERGRWEGDEPLRRLLGIVPTENLVWPITVSAGPM